MLSSLKSLFVTQDERDVSDSEVCSSSRDWLIALEELESFSQATFCLDFEDRRIPPLEFFRELELEKAGIVL